MNLRQDWLGIMVGALAAAAVLLGILEGDVHTVVLAFGAVCLTLLTLIQKRTIRSLQEQLPADD